MIHKVLNHGADASRNPFDYLLTAGRAVAPEVLMGNPEITWANIRSLEFAKVYTSVVLSFEELLPKRCLWEIMQSYERLAFAGVDEKEISRSWVHHGDHGRSELHCIIANVHLGSGKRLQPYYHKQDCRLFINWTEMINAHYGLSSPSVAREYLTDPGVLRGYPTAKAKAYCELDREVAMAVREGKIRCRADLVRYLETEGWIVTREAPRWVTVQKPEWTKGMRMRGPKYAADFDAVAFRRALQRPTEVKPDPAKAAALASEVEIFWTRRAERNRKRYRSANPFQNFSQNTENQNEYTKTDRNHPPPHRDLGTPFSGSRTPRPDSLGNPSARETGQHDRDENGLRGPPEHTGGVEGRNDRLMQSDVDAGLGLAPVPAGGSSAGPEPLDPSKGTRARPDQPVGRDEERGNQTGAHRVFHLGTTELKKERRLDSDSSGAGSTFAKWIAAKVREVRASLESGIRKILEQLKRVANDPLRAPRDPAWVKRDLDFLEAERTKRLALFEQTKAAQQASEKRLRESASSPPPLPSGTQSENLPTEPFPPGYKNYLAQPLSDSGESEEEGYNLT